MRFYSRLIMTLIICEGLAAAAVGPGESRTNVIAELGRPLESLKKGDYEMLRFARGRVELLNGIVVTADLTNHKKSQDKTEHPALSGSRQAVAAALLNAPQYKGMSAKERLRALRDLHRQYPEIDLTDELLSVAADLQREAGDAVKDEKIKLLEQELSDARLELIQAGRHSEKLLEKYGSNRRDDYYYPVYPLIYTERSGYFSIGNNSPGGDFGVPLFPVVRPLRR